MSEDRNRLIEDLLAQALGLAHAEREDLLDHACAGDDALRREVESLLELEARARGFLDRPAPEHLESLDPGDGSPSDPETESPTTGSLTN